MPSAAGRGVGEQDGVVGVEDDDGGIHQVQEPPGQLAVVADRRRPAGSARRAGRPPAGGSRQTARAAISRTDEEADHEGGQRTHARMRRCGRRRIGLDEGLSARSRQCSPSGGWSFTGRRSLRSISS